MTSDSDWTGESCCDRWVCGFMYGDRVVLIGEAIPTAPRACRGAQRAPSSAATTQHDNSVLVSWDLWTQGGSDEAYLICNERMLGIFPPGSTWWVPVTDLAKYVRSECGILQPIQICSGRHVCGSHGIVRARSRLLLSAGPGAGGFRCPKGKSVASRPVCPYATLPEGLVVTSACRRAEDLGRV
jgi:hypothetical protein